MLPLANCIPKRVLLDKIYKKIYLYVRTLHKYHAPLYSISRKFDMYLYFSN